MPAKALLAIRSDIAPEVQIEYLDWLTKEHTIERVGIDGFLSARIYRADRSDVNRFWIIYELENAAVVDSPAYLERLNNPTRWTSKMMPHLGNFVRGGGEIAAAAGAGFGACFSPIVNSEPLSVEQEDLEKAAAISRVVSVQHLLADVRRTSVPTNEKSMRSGDRTFASMLMVHALDGTSLSEAVHQVSSGLPEQSPLEEGNVASYSLLFSLAR